MTCEFFDEVCNSCGQKRFFIQASRPGYSLWSASGKKPAQTGTDPLLCLLLPIGNCAKEGQIRLRKLPGICRKAWGLITCARTFVPQVWDDQPFIGMMQQQR